MTIQQPVSVPPAPPAEAAPEANARVTPMMEQFLEIKAAHPGLLLFYRMGDFYELFFEDAEIASKALGIMLTKRGKHQGADIPMCGVPVERSDDYLHRLIAQGFRVAVCEQMEDPAAAKARGGKSVAIDGEPPKPRTVVIAFESLEQAQATFASAAYRDGRKVGDKYAKFRIWATEGVAK